MHGLYGKKSIDDSFLTPPVMEVGTTVVPATTYSYWDYTHTCSEHVASAEVTLGFQTQWRTSDPVRPPGNLPAEDRYEQRQRAPASPSTSATPTTRAPG